MLLTNSCGISFAFTKILNEERIGWLFKNKIDFYFGLGWHKAMSKENPNHQKKSSMSSLCDTEEEMAASWLLNDLRVKYKLKNPVIQTSQRVSLSFVLSHPPQVPLRNGHCKSPLNCKDWQPSMLKCCCLSLRSHHAAQAWL